MRKLLTAGIFGTILSLTGANYAGASIISRGFFDEAMENYATNTALDLKANQTDLTALSNKIGDAWPYDSDMSSGLYKGSWQLYPQEITLENASDLVRFLFGGKIESGINQGGVLNILGQSVVDIGAYDVNTGQIDNNGFRSLTQLTNGWASTDGTTYLGVKDLNTKTGSYYWGPENEEYKYSNIPYLEELFPSTSPKKSIAMTDMATSILVNYTDTASPGLAGVTFRLLGGWPDANGALANPGLKGMYEGWTDRGGNYYPGLYSYSKGETLLLNAYNSESVPLLIQGAKATTIDGVDYRGPVYPLWKLSEGVDKIGTLPSGSLLGLSQDSDQIYKAADGTDTPVYPANVAEMIQQLYGAPQAGHRGIIPVIGRNISDISQSITTRIGTLPTEIPNTDSIWEQYGFAEMGTPIDLPDTIGGMFAMLFNDDDSYNGLSLGRIMTKILTGFNATYGSRIEGLSPLTSVYNLRGNSPIVTAVNANTAKIGTVPDGKNLAGMISETDAKIGTLPTEIPNTGPIWEQYGFAEMGTPIDLPDTIGGMFAMLFNNDGPYNEPSLESIMVKILMGFSTSSNTRIEGLANLTSAYKLVGDSPIVTAVKANATKIGTLPSAYDSVGAALTAMKSDIDAKNLPSTSDDGQYVLTAKKVGDTITYTWVKMDLTNEEQAQ